jgi:antitoxin MazE
MVTRITKWGNSQGLRLPKQMLEEMDISVGDDVEVKLGKDGILIRPVPRAGKKYSLRALVSEMPGTYKVSEADWGPPVGNEVW